MQEAPTPRAEGPIELRSPRILAAIAVMALSLAGCWLWDEGGPPPPPDIRGEWLAAHTEGDTELELTVDINEPAPHVLIGDTRLRVTEPDEFPLVIHGYITGTYYYPFVDMDFRLFLVAGQDPVEALFEGRFDTDHAIGGAFVLNNPVGQTDTLALILRRR
ncbi:MAG: hypothetical protein OXI83_12670 [Gemmatimonadota bacterium]|nr:hypothetical protein [Gemmatimonadota bacterium]